MKLLIFLLFSANIIFASNSSDLHNHSPQRISPFAYQVSMLIKNNNTNELKDKFITVNENNKTYIPCLIRVNNNINERSLIDNGIIINTKAGNIWSVMIEIEKFNTAISIPEINYIQVDKPISLNLEEVNAVLNTDQIHFAELLSEKYTGKDVIVGIIDVGFDLNHPFFEDKNGNTRIKKAWFQNNSSQSKPDGFDYGQEIYPKDFYLYKTDSRYASHGSHVTGIAAGGYKQSIEGFRGLAPESEIILVSPIILTNDLLQTSSPNILDGIDYIFDYAKKVGKPAVINISLGTSLGPHDGTALFDEACGYLVNMRYGNILVTSAGNDGMLNFVIQKPAYEDFTAHFSTSEDPESQSKTHYIDIWGEKGSNFCVQVGIYINNNIIWDGKSYCTSSPGNYGPSIMGPSPYRLTYNLNAAEYSFNQKPRILMNFTASEYNSGVIRITNSTGKVTLWHCGTGGSTAGEFIKGAGFATPNNEISISEIGGNSVNFITVGSYNTKYYKNGYRMYGFLQDISTFSSLGNTVDSRIKPDITAPGSFINSSFNNNQYNFQDLWFDSRDLEGFPYGYMAGTSMSSPVVTGSIALMLQANSLLEVSEIRDIFKTTGTQDQFTSTIPNKHWGNGKLNIYSSIVEAKKIDKFVRGSFYPNPFYDNPTYSMSREDSISNVSYEIYDFLGNFVKEQDIIINGTTSVRIPTAELSQGFYYIKIKEKYFDLSTQKFEYKILKIQNDN